MEKTRILVVDDEESLCEILKFNLEKAGYAVDTALSAEEALTMNLTAYHLMILDVMMGEISGFQMADILKKKKETTHIPIIFCTARDTEDDTVHGLQLGADDYISKPFFDPRSTGTCRGRTASKHTVGLRAACRKHPAIRKPEAGYYLEKGKSRGAGRLTDQNGI